MPEHPLSPLESLPFDIVTIISSFLSAPTILHLHLTSQTLSSKIPFTQSFYRHHLISGSLIPYIWDLDPSTCCGKDTLGTWDWKRLAVDLGSPTKILEAALGKSLKGRENDEFTTAFEDRSRGEREFRDAPIGLQNRCRLVKIVRDVERMDEIEEGESVVDGEKRRHFGGLFV